MFLSIFFKAPLTDFVQHAGVGKNANDRFGAKQSVISIVSSIIPAKSGWVVGSPFSA